MLDNVELEQAFLHIFNYRTWVMTYYFVAYAYVCKLSETSLANCDNQWNITIP